MTTRTTRRFDKNYAKLPLILRLRVDKQLRLLIDNPRHPSLRLKKMAGRGDLWEGRVTRGYRFVFRTVGNEYILDNVGSHDILTK